MIRGWKKGAFNSRLEVLQAQLHAKHALISRAVRHLRLQFPTFLLVPAQPRTICVGNIINMQMQLIALKLHEVNQNRPCQIIW